MINVLTLTGAFFMLQIYDRVLPGRSVPTLVALAILAGVLFAFLGILDLIRSRVLIRIGAYLDQSLSGRVYHATIQLPLKSPKSGDGLQPFRDLDQVRSFLSGAGPTALFDLPWLPIYLAICFMFHPLIGWAALAGALVLITLTLLTELLVRGPTRAVVTHAGTRNALAEASRRNAEILRAMGMAERVSSVWADANANYLKSHQRASDISGSLGAMSKVFRMALQSGILAVGAWLVLQQEATGGVIIAAAILSARALAPVELAIANWKNFIGARQSWKRMNELLGLFPVDGQPMALPKPFASLAVEALSVAPPGGRKLVLQDIAFSLKSGNGLGIIGPSASGKSTLARAIVGVWAPARGQIRLDGAAIEQWSPVALGQHIGYLPQDVELFAGTVAQNISRFESEADPAAVLAAAKAAGVNEVVLNLAGGYDAQIGEGGTALSAGQCQRIALARALYGDPFLIVLDEPNSNLDAEGEKALTQAILGVRARGGIIVVIAHRPSAIEGVDLLLMLTNGRVQAFGPKDEMLRKVLRPATQQPPALKAVPDKEKTGS
jgi:ATP-binding cassette subfamily C protein